MSIISDYAVRAISSMRTGVQGMAVSADDFAKSLKSSASSAIKTSDLTGKINDELKSGRHNAVEFSSALTGLNLDNLDPSNLSESWGRTFKMSQENNRKMYESMSEEGKKAIMKNASEAIMGTVQMGSKVEEAMRSHSATLAITAEHSNKMLEQVKNGGVIGAEFAMKQALFTENAASSWKDFGSSVGTVMTSFRENAKVGIENLAVAVHEAATEMNSFKSVVGALQERQELLKSKIVGARNAFDSYADVVKRLNKLKRDTGTLSKEEKDSLKTAIKAKKILKITEKDLNEQLEKTIKNTESANEELDKSIKKNKELYDSLKGVTEGYKEEEMSTKARAIASVLLAASFKAAADSQSSLRTAFLGANIPIHEQEEMMGALRSDMVRFGYGVDEVAGSYGELAAILPGIKKENSTMAGEMSFMLLRTMNMTTKAAAEMAFNLENVWKVGVDKMPQVGAAMLSVADRTNLTTDEAAMLVSEMTPFIYLIPQRVRTELIPAFGAFSAEMKNVGGNAQEWSKIMLSTLDQSNGGAQKLNAILGGQLAPGFSSLGAMFLDSTKGPSAAMEAMKNGLGDLMGGLRDENAMLAELSMNATVYTSVLGLSAEQISQIIRHAKLQKDIVKLIGKDAADSMEFMKKKTSEAMNTINTRLDQIRATFAYLAVVIGQRLLPVIMPVVESIGKLIDVFHNLDPWIKGFLTWTVIVIGFASAIVSLGPMIVGAIVAPFKLVIGFFGLFGKAAVTAGAASLVGTSKIGAAMGIMRTALFAFPLPLIAKGALILGALTLAVMGIGWAMGQAAPLMVAFGKVVESGFSGIVSVVSELGKFAPTLAWALPAMGMGFSAMGVGLVALAAGALAAVGPLWLFSKAVGGDGMFGGIKKIVDDILTVDSANLKMALANLSSMNILIGMIKAYYSGMRDIQSISLSEESLKLPGFEALSKIPELAASTSASRNLGRSASAQSNGDNALEQKLSKLVELTISIEKNTRDISGSAEDARKDSRMLAAGRR